MAEPYKPGFQSAHERVTKRDHTGKYGQGQMLSPRKRVGDADPEGKAKFQSELANARRPAGTRGASPPAPAAAPASKESTYTKPSGALRTRKERIDYEVSKATGD